MDQDPILQNIEDYRPAESLTLAITQLDHHTPAQQRKLVQRWCALLPNLREVKSLTFCSRVTQEMFDAACAMPNLEALSLKWTGLTNLRALPSATRLRRLRIGASSRLEGIDELAVMKNLVHLNLEQFNKIDDFTPVAGLTQLQTLGLDGSIWTAQRLRSLEPVAGLVNLTMLTFTNTKAADPSFDPLLGLHRLERLHCSWNYPEAELAKLKRLPNLKYGNVETSWKEVKRRLADGNANAQG